MMPGEEPLILTVDIGTTSCKAGLVTPTGRIVACVQESDTTPVYFLPEGGAEQDPDEWWATITRTVRRLLEESGVRRDDIKALGFTAPWSGTVPVDREGRPLGRAIIWMDTRGAKYVRKLTGGPISVEGYGLDKALIWIYFTGGIPTHSGKDSIAHILFIKYERPEIYRATYKFLEPKDYLNLRLTGKFAADFTSIILHWVTDNRDINDIHYEKRLLRMTGIEREKLPDLYPTTHVLGPLTPQAAEALDLPEGLPVIISTPDLQAAILGSYAVQDYQPHIYLGTSSWLSCHVPYKKTDLKNNMASLPSAVPGRYFVANEQETSGVCLTFLRDRLFYAEDILNTGPAPENAYRLLDELAALAPPGSNGVIFTPWLYGERTPVEDETLRGAFFNLSLNTTRSEMVRAVLEGVAFNTRWLMGAVEQFIRRPLGAINIIGGGAVSELWCQIFADVLNRPLRQVEYPAMAGLRGIGVLAGLSLGLSTLEEYAREAIITRTFEPNPDNRRIYDELFQVFLDLYRRNRSLYRRLNRRFG